MYNGHLSIEEIDQLSQQKGAAENQSHMENCRQCQALLEKHRTVSAKLDQLASVRIGAKNGMNCPDERVWFDVAAGTLASDESLRQVQHAAECEACAQRLRTATRMFQEELSPEEEKEIAALPSASARQQKKMAQRIAAVVSSDVSASQQISPKRKRSLWWPLSLSLAGAAAVTAVVLFAWPRNSPADVEKLLAQAYTEDRTIEMRIPGAKHAEIRQQRGAADDGSFVDLPESFRKAADRIALGLRTSPKNDQWLLLEARLDLLQAHYHAALSALVKIATPSSAQHYHLTMGIALLQKGESESDRDSYLQAIEQFSAALDETPHDPVALFNRGLAYDKLNLLQNASDDWKSVLDAETDPGWRSEASQYLTADGHKLQKEHKLNDLLTPQQFKSAPAAQIDAYAEQYQDIAMRSWLSHAVAEPNSDFAVATRRLARIMKKNHFDLWLTAALVSATRADVPGFVALGAAVTANSNGYYRDALSQAHNAGKVFARTGNQPGELRARYEEVYAFQRFLQGSSCLARAAPLFAHLYNTGYSWLQAQASLEKAICENFIGTLERARKDLEASRRVAEGRHFPVLLLRSLGLAASIARQQGQFDDAWIRISQGLALYWNGDFPAERLYQLYMVLGLYSEQKSLWRVAESLERTAIGKIQNGPNHLLEGTAHLQLANVLIAETKDNEAAAEIQSADAALNPIKDDPLTNTYRLTARVELSGLQLRRGNPVLALSTLDSAVYLVHSTEGYFISINFYRTRGDIYLSLGRLGDASHDYLTAVRQADKSLKWLRDEASRQRWIREADRGYRGLVRVMLRQGKAEVALRLWEWYRSRSLFAHPSMLLLSKVAIQLTDATSSEHLQTLLLNLPFPRPTQPHLIYAAFEDGLQIWTLGPRGIYGSWVPVPERSLAELSDRFVRQCSTPASSLQEIHLLGYQLYDMLLRPVVSALQTSDSVVLEMDNPLAGLPLEALTTPGGDYFGDQHPIVYSPGYFVEINLRRMHQLTSQSPGLFIDTSEFYGQSPIASYISEKDTIQGLFPKVTMMDASTTTWSSALRRLATVEFAHFLAHGVQDGGHTALLLSLHPRRTLEATDLTPLKMSHLQLVVLAACRTSAEDGDSMIDASSLIHPFLSAGVPNVVAARWNIDSGMTAKLMMVFYGHLGQGELPPRALQAARTEYIRRSLHPFYWAGLAVIGRSW